MYAYTRISLYMSEPSLVRFASPYLPGSPLRLPLLESGRLTFPLLRLALPHYHRISLSPDWPIKWNPRRAVTTGTT